MKKEHDFGTDGFVVLRGVFAEPALAQLRAALVDIIAYADRQLEDPFSRYYLRHRSDQGVLYDLYQRHPEFVAFARNEAILDVLEQVIGPDIFLYENSVVYKPKGRSNGVPFHQDFISRPHEPAKFIAWMAIDRVTRDSGALKVVPGSHRNGFLPWYRARGETHHDRIREDALRPTQVKHIELEPGDVLIFNQLLVHGSDEMHTASLRLVYRVSYQGFDEIFTPRGSPIVVRGGTPQSVSARYPRPHQPEPRRPFWRRALNYIGRRLAKI